MQVMVMLRLIALYLVLVPTKGFDAEGLKADVSTQCFEQEAVIQTNPQAQALFQNASRVLETIDYEDACTVDEKSDADFIVTNCELDIAALAPDETNAMVQLCNQVSYFGLLNL